MKMKMRKTILQILLLTVCLTAFGQAKKPTLMVVPSDTWCIENGFTKQFQIDGETKTVPDYEAALQGNGDLKIAITTIGTLMSDRGFPLKDMEQTLKSISLSEAEDMATTSKTGASVEESPLDIINKRAKSDIILDLYWKEVPSGPRKALTFNLRALDAYTNKQIAGVNGTSEPSMTSELSELLTAAVIGGIDNFNNQMMTYFTDMADKGREVGLNVRIWEGSPVNLESEVKGSVLTDLIEDWVADNTVKGVYNLADATESMMTFEQVRIPLYDANERALDTRRWARGLANILRSKGLNVKLNMRGLGLATIIIGEKE